MLLAGVDIKILQLFLVHHSHRKGFKKEWKQKWVILDLDLASTALSRRAHNKNVFPFISEFWHMFQKMRINPIAEKQFLVIKTMESNFYEHSEWFFWCR